MAEDTHRYAVTKIEGDGDISTLSDPGPKYARVKVTLMAFLPKWDTEEITMVLDHGDPCPAIGDIYKVTRIKTGNSHDISITKET